jgi:hypothetical protein
MLLKGKFESSSIHESKDEYKLKYSTNLALPYGAGYKPINTYTWIKSRISLILFA